MCAAARAIVPPPKVDLLRAAAPLRLLWDVFSFLPRRNCAAFSIWAADGAACAEVELGKCRERCATVALLARLSLAREPRPVFVGPRRNDESRYLVARLPEGTACGSRATTERRCVGVRASLCAYATTRADLSRAVKAALNMEVI